MDISETEVMATVAWMPEHELPEWIGDDEYNILFLSSQVRDGIRVFPYISLCKKQIFLIGDK